MQNDPPTLTTVETLLHLVTAGDVISTPEHHTGPKFRVLEVLRNPNTTDAYAVLVEPLDLPSDRDWWRPMYSETVARVVAR
jgi:hypothetical protein